MAAKYEVMYINKVNSPFVNEMIRDIGGIKDGEYWKITQQQAIKYIKNEIAEFYMFHNRKRMDLIVGKSKSGKYLKTISDGEMPDNLLRLPECPPY